MYENEIFNAANDEKMMSVKNMLDSISHLDTNGNPFWYARDLMGVLGYSKWQKFEILIERSINACQSYGYNPSDHFVPGDKMIPLAKGAMRRVKDYKLSKFACKLVCQNGDPSQKPIVGIAQSYFAIAANNYEDMIDKYNYESRVNPVYDARETDKGFNSALYSHGVTSSKGIGTIKSKGDEAFFGGFNTQQMKQKLGIAKNVSLNDCLDSLPLSFKTAAMELSKRQILDNNICGQKNITTLHVNNNEATRNFMINNGYYPENFPAQENFRKLERRTNKIEEIEPDTLVIATDVDTGETVIVRSPFQKIDLNEYYKNNKD